MTSSGFFSSWIISGVYYYLLLLLKIIYYKITLVSYLVGDYTLIGEELEFNLKLSDLDTQSSY